MTVVRRSTRARHQPESVYDEAKSRLEKERKEIEEDRGSDEEKSENEGSDDGMETEEESPQKKGQDDDVSSSSSEEEESDDDEAFQVRSVRKSPAKKKQPMSARTNNRTKTVTPPRQPKQRQDKKKKAIQVVRVKPASAAARGAKATAGGGTAAVRRQISVALATCSKKVLDSEETPENALVAGLLHSYKPMTTTAEEARNSRRSSLSKEETRTVYTPALETLARRVIERHSTNPNQSQIDLLNLLFRSVGGTTDSNLDPSNMNLDEMDEDDWGRTVTALVEEMRHTPPDQVLLCADPYGAAHSAAIGANKDGEKEMNSVTKASIASREYRKIYMEFWYVLGGMALSEGGMAAKVVEHDDDEDDIESSDNDEMTFPSSDKKSKRKSMSKTVTSTIKYDAELARDLIMRILELVSVAQPDVRAAAVIACLEMGHAILDKTIVLGTKLDIASRQLAAAIGVSKGKSRSSKVESLQHQVDSLKRTRADLDEIVLGPVIQGVFIHRYRDSNMHIRAHCLDALSRMTIQRPDLFLNDKYLKYFGWMMSDKDECVRLASLKGLHAPFAAAKKGSKVDLSAMENVVNKFLKRVTQCTLDVSIQVQEQAMALLLGNLREGFFDDVDDEKMWNQINICALAEDTSPAVRRDALYFVMEQLEAFDEDEDEEEDNAANRKKNANALTAQSSEKRSSQRLDALASWVAHSLSNGPIPIEKIRVHLADLVVLSLRNMPEHKSIVTNWSAMLRTITEDKQATTTQGTSAGERVDIAKQRVLVQMLACAARSEVGAVADMEFLLRDVDADIVAATMPNASDGSKPSKKGRASTSTSIQHESLSVALLKALPNLLTKFQSDPAILGSLASLPQYLIPTVFSLPQRKGDFLSLTERLSEIYLQSPDDTVLRNTALALVYLSRGDHARISDAKLQLQNVIQELRDRLIELFSGETSKESSTGGSKKSKKKSNSSPRRSRRSSRSSTSSAASDEEEETEETSSETDVEYSIFLNLKRLRILAKRISISDFLQTKDGTNEDDTNSDIEALCSFFVDGLVNRMKVRKPVFEDDVDDEEDSKEAKLNVWKPENKKRHDIVAKSTEESMNLLLAIISWELLAAREKEGLTMKDEDDMLDESKEADDEDDDASIEEHLLIRLRDQLVTLVELCFDQFLSEEEAEDGNHSPEQFAFSDAVQFSACRVASDLRTLLPKEWADAASPLLRGLSTREDGRLIGGFVRFFRTKEGRLRANEELEEEDKDPIHSLLLPLCRSLGMNWAVGNRREAGTALAHITGSGQDAAAMVSALSRVLKKTGPVRFLEAHMASLRQAFDTWMDSEPEELETDRPTDAEMTAFEEAEKNHTKQFQTLEHHAARLSSSLGVGKLSEDLSPALLAFIREGVRFSFSTTEDGEDDLVLGSRLSFLTIVSKYVNWIKRSKNQRETIKQDLRAREEELQNHPEFNEVHEDDLAALAMFRGLLGLSAISKSPSSASRNQQVETNVTQDEEDEEDDEESADEVGDLTGTPNSTGRANSFNKRISRSSIGTANSHQSNLSPLVEGDDESPIAPSSGSSRVSSGSKRSRPRPGSYGGKSQSTYTGKTQSTVEGSDSEDNDDDESDYSRLFESLKTRGGKKRRT